MAFKNMPWAMILSFSGLCSVAMDGATLWQRSLLAAAVTTVLVLLNVATNKSTRRP